MNNKTIIAVTTAMTIFPINSYPLSFPFWNVFTKKIIATTKQRNSIPTMITFMT